jgi:hypothetical protein
LPSQKFACDKCGKIHESEPSAAACEKKHKGFEVVRAHYGQYDPMFPSGITLRFDGGREQYYEFRPRNGDED